MYFNERMPDCAPEFYRSRQADADEQYEKRLQREERYKKNREKLEKAGKDGNPSCKRRSYGGLYHYRFCRHPDNCVKPVYSGRQEWEKKRKKARTQDG